MQLFQVLLCFKLSPDSERHFRFHCQAVQCLLKGDKSVSEQGEQPKTTEAHTRWVQSVLCSVVRVLISLLGEDNYLFCCQEMAAADKLVKI